MYSRSISPSCVRNVQDVDIIVGKAANPPPSREKFFDGPRRLHVAERDSAKFYKKSFFNWSSLIQNGKRVVSGLSFSKSHLPKQSTSNETGGSFFARTNTVSAASNFYPRQDPCFRFCDSPRGDSSKFVSATPSFRTSSLHGLSYVAALHSGAPQVSFTGHETDQSAKVVTASSISSKRFGPGSNACDSPHDVFTSFSDDSEESGSPLFDPDLLNAFEKALANVDKDLFKTSEGIPCNPTTSPDFVHSKTHTEEQVSKSDAREFGSRRRKISIGNSEGFLGLEKKNFEDARRILEGLLGNHRGKRDPSICKKDLPLESSNPLNNFARLCPSDGDQKAVLFLTSLRGIRKTFENCSNIRNLLRTFSVKIDERDVSMHHDFKHELKTLLGRSVSLPRLFVKGRYIGGAEEIIRLHEEGILEKLLEDLPRITSFKECEACGEMRFIPCSRCSGSRKIISNDNKIKRCPDCNENGIVRCLVCS